MDVMQRNFFRLLRSGAFGDTAAIEAMSPWKWRRVYQASLVHGVAALVADGIRNHSGDFFMQLPADLAASWNKTVSDIEAANRNCNISVSELFGTLGGGEHLRPILLKGQGLASLYPNPLHRTCGDIDFFFPFEAQGRKADEWAKANGADASVSDKGTWQYSWHGTMVEHHHRAQKLTNPLLNRRLQDIINSEIRCCDSAFAIVNGMKIEVVPPTLNLLLIMLRTARYVISEGISLKQIVDLGIFLRSMGANVDYVKLQDWIARLGMERMARLERALLVHLLKFSDDEIPFVERTDDEDTERIEADLFRLDRTHSAEWYFQQGKNIFVHNTNSGAMMWHINHSARYFRYYPKETATNFVSLFLHSISHIEE